MENYEPAISYVFISLRQKKEAANKKRKWKYTAYAKKIYDKNKQIVT